MTFLGSQPHADRAQSHSFPILSDHPNGGRRASLWTASDHAAAWLQLEELESIDKDEPDVIDLRVRI
jgi:hypothetical protein